METYQIVLSVALYLLMGLGFVGASIPENAPYQRKFLIVLTYPVVLIIAGIYKLVVNHNFTYDEDQ